MAVYKRDDIKQAFDQIQNGDIAPVYLVFGERFLCQETIGKLVAFLLPDLQQRQQNVTLIDGDREDPSQTFSSLRSFSLFPGRQVYRVADTRLFYSKDVAQSLWDKAKEAFDAKQTQRALASLGAVLAISGMDGSDQSEWNLVDLSDKEWQQLFGFAKPDDISWAETLLQENSADLRKLMQDKSTGDAGEQLIGLLEGGIPDQNVLILQTDTVDKRKKLYKYLSKHAVVIDVSVDSGSHSAARQEQHDVVRGVIEKVLAEYNKKASSEVFALLLERVGFHPVAARMETEKLALSVGDGSLITRDDVEEMVGHTREEALYELNEAVAQGNPDMALRVLSRILESGLHPLAVVAALRNYLRRLLLVRSFLEQDEPFYEPRMAYGAFQKRYLPALKKAKGNSHELLKGHPFVVYKLFSQAEKVTLIDLQKCLACVLDAEYHLKGSAVSDRIILEDCLLRILEKM